MRLAHRLFAHDAHHPSSRRASQSHSSASKKNSTWPSFAPGYDTFPPGHGRIVRQS